MNKYAAQSKASQRQRRMRRACADKKRYDTEEAAFQKGQASYKCRHCDGWHRTGQIATLAAIVKGKR